MTSFKSKFRNKSLNIGAIVHKKNDPDKEIEFATVQVPSVLPRLIKIEDGDKVDKYIIFALDYSYNVNSKNEMTCKEIYEFLKDNFKLKYTEEDIKNIGVSPIMLEKNITYDSIKDSYKMNIINKDGQTISSTPIIYYKLEKISKSNKKKFVMTYRKYTIENPHDMLNFYINKNMNTNGEELDSGEMVYNLVDTTPIKNYLLGNGKIGDVKDLIKDEDISKYAKKGSKKKVTFIVEDDKILCVNCYNRTR